MAMSQSIEKIFSEVAVSYEKVNHLLTFNLDRRWRRRAAGVAAEQGGKLWLDACSGTGEMAQSLAALAPVATKIFAVDFNHAMIAQGLKRAPPSKIAFLISDVQALPFPDKSFELVTISFATRNINLNRHALLNQFKEFHRILKPGGCFVNLETSQPHSRIIKKIFHLYVRTFIPMTGTLISSSKAGYRYLASTICRFYRPEELSQILYQAGFSSVSHQSLLLGAVAIHRAQKSNIL